ncbi:hypothetical protein GCM10020367_42810 [Streptomyces sannanensis]|uniref:DUF3703 domain-containing protein n=1 Tax=Streptomyces sannanensis TaxID=285536 RepID=A0ABP6SFB4_9ACTN
MTNTWAGSAGLHPGRPVYGGAIGAATPHAHHSVQVIVALSGELVLASGSGEEFVCRAAVVRAAFEGELARAYAATSTDEMWRALERAHILSQSWAWPHIRAHWHMFRLAVRCRDRTETVGQLVRIAVAGPGSLTGRVPRGNTGRTRVGLLTPMPVPEDLARTLGGEPASV